MVLMEFVVDLSIQMIEGISHLVLVIYHAYFLSVLFVRL